MEEIKRITDDGEVLALILPATARSTETFFVTEPSESFQMGFIVKDAGAEVPAHRHKPAARTISETAEFLLVRDGKCEVDIFSTRGAVVATHQLKSGDIALLLRGGHRLRMLEPTIFVEVKQGPYLGQDEKQFLDDQG